MSDAPLLGRLIGGRYRVERLIASGGMASVYLAEDTRLERNVALKVIHAHLADNPSFRNKFIREARIAAKLSHPNLVNVFDQGEDGRLIYLAMEYVPGITLRQAIEEHAPLDATRSLEIIEPILAGLAAAHTAGILHRDLKPENVFLSDFGAVKLGDFGLARSISNQTQTGSLIGTVAYLSPELVTRGEADARSDVYAAGILLFEMLTGRQPFLGDQAVQVAFQHANHQVPAPSSLQASVPSLLDELVLWATARDPQHRPTDAAAFLSAVRQAKLDLSQNQTADTLRPARFSDRTRVLSDLTNIQEPQPKAVAESAGPESAGQSAAAHTEILTDLEASSETWQQTPLERLGQARKKRAAAIAFLSGLVLLLGLGSGWWFGAGPGGFASIPQLANRKLAGVTSAVSGLTENFRVIDEFSSSVGDGYVIRTEPAAGQFFLKGSNLKIIVSKGPRMSRVPALNGLDLRTATTKLAQSNFSAGSSSEYFNPAKVGSVFDYLGSDLQPVAESTPIRLKISLGPLPSVSGLTQATAITNIQSQGLVVSSIESEFSDSVAAGLALRLTPLTDPIGRGGKVALWVSKGPNLVIMPTVVGETLSAAQTLLVSLQLTVKVNTDQLRQNWGIVKVKSVSVSPGTKLRVHDTVVISNLR